jgi:hypothetical protein
MKIFHYHPDTGELLGEGIADESPLEPGVWLVPASATALEPPTAPEGEVAVFVNDSWTLQPIPTDDSTPVVTEPEKLVTTEERLARYGFTVNELRALMLGQEVTL